MPTTAYRFRLPGAGEPTDHDDARPATPGDDADLGTADPVAALCALIEPLDGEPRTLAADHVGRVAPLAPQHQRDEIIDAAVARLVGLGSLHRFLVDAAVDEVLVNGSGDVWAERDGLLQRVTTIEPGELAVTLERILAPLGRRLDRTNPVVDARLPDGSRVCAVVSPVAVDGTVVAIRRFRVRRRPLDDFAAPPVVALIERLVTSRSNIIISGQTSSGKTTLLGSILDLPDPPERLVVVEDNAELSPSGDNVVRLEARHATPDQPTEINLAELVRTAMRLRPDRLIIGEVRGDEVVALVNALNTGHAGSLSTVHANSPFDALIRLETLVLQAAPAWPLTAVRQHLQRSIDVVIQTARGRGGHRRISDIAEVVEHPDGSRVRPLVIDGELVGEPSRSRA